MKTFGNSATRILITLLSVVITVCFTTQALVANEQEQWKNLTEQANTLYRQEEYEKAIAVSVQALELAEKHFGPEHAVTISSMISLANYYTELGYPDQSMPLYEQALEFSQKTVGENDPETVNIMVALAGVYGEQALYNQAIPLLEKALFNKKDQLGEKNADTLSTQITLAQVFEAQGNFQKAETLFKEAIEKYESSMGSDHPDTLFARESLASVYKSQGRYNEAKEILSQLLDKKTDVLGPRNSETIYTMGNLAEVLHKTGEYDEAEELFIKTIDLSKKVLGEDDLDLYTTMGNLAVLYQDQGKYEEAEQLFLKVYQFDSQILGINHPNTIIDSNNLAGIYRLRGQYNKAEKSYQQSLALIKEALGEKHPETISIMNNLALLFENLGLYDKAEPLFKTALIYAESGLGEKHPTTLALMNNLASLYESQGVFERSEPLYNKAIQLNEEVYGSNHPNTISSINNLGYLYLVQENYSKAEPLFSRVYELWKIQLGEKHQKTLKSLNNLARVYHWQGKTDAAEQMFLTALDYRNATLGEKHPDVVRSMVDLAALYTTKKNYSEAENLLKKTVTLSEEILGEKHQYTFEALNNLANLYEKTGEEEKALDVRQKVFERRTDFFDRVLWAAGENTRQSYIELHKHEQNRFLTLLIKKRTPESAKKALSASLHRKGLLLKITSEIHKIVEMSESPELAKTASALNKKRKQLASMTLSGPTSQTPEEFRKTVTRLENELEELQAELGRISVIYHIATKPVSVDDIYKNMSVDDVLIDYITYHDKTDKVFAVVAQTNPEECFVWWECIGNQIDMIPLGNLEGIQKSISIFRETIQDEDADEEDVLETGHEVFQKVWQPLQELIRNKKSIYIVPDSVLHLLPFDALVDENDNFLIQNKDLKVLSSSRDLVVSALPDAQGDFMILAGPDYDIDNAQLQKEKQVIASTRSGEIDRGIRMSHGLRSLSFEPLLGAEIEGKTIKQVSDGFDPLKGAEDEGKSINKVARSSNGNSIIYTKREAEEQQLRTVGKSPSMVHIATHGFFLQAEERLKRRLLSLQRGGTHTTPPPGDNPLLRAGLAFAGINTNAPFLGEIDTDNDGVLTALEVLGLRLSGTQLVVLSACETGVGEIHAGEGVYGLRRAFQEAGVKSVVNSLWPVSDEGTRRLMTSFYKNMFNGMPPRKALKSAQLTLLNSEWSSPYYWSSFVLVERRFSANQ